MKKTAILSVLLLIIGSMVAQTHFIEKGKNYSLTRIYSKKTGIIKASSFQLVNDTIASYNLMNSNSGAKIVTSNINFVTVKVGNHALAYGLYGGGLGLLSALYGVLSVKSDPTLDDSGVNWAPFIIGFTAGGAAVGAIVGAFSIKWRRLYVPTKSTSDRLYFAPVINTKYCGTQLVYKF